VFEEPSSYRISYYLQRYTSCPSCSHTVYTVKKGLAVFPSPVGMSLIKLFLGGNNLVFPSQ
jgi:hypothetical protein